MLLPMRHPANPKPQNLRRSLIETDLLVAEELVARPDLPPRGDISQRKLVITLAGAFEFQVGKSMTWVDPSRLLFANAGESYVDHHVVPGTGHSIVILTPGEEALDELPGNVDAHFAERVRACSLRTQMLAQMLRRAEGALAAQEIGLRSWKRPSRTTGASAPSINGACAGRGRPSRIVPMVG